jgi:hypothetical protein
VTTATAPIGARPEIGPGNSRDFGQELAALVKRPELPKKRVSKDGSDGR